MFRFPFTAPLFAAGLLALAVPAPAATFHPAQGPDFDPARDAAPTVWRQSETGRHRIGSRGTRAADPGFLFAADPWAHGQPPIPSVVTGPWRTPDVAQSPPMLSVTPSPAPLWLLGGAALSLAVVGVSRRRQRPRPEAVHAAPGRPAGRPAARPKTEDPSSSAAPRGRTARRKAASRARNCLPASARG